jgi:hypothetical protein
MGSLYSALRLWVIGGADDVSDVEQFNKGLHNTSNKAPTTI